MTITRKFKRTITPPAVRVGPAGRRGRGVYATRRIRRGEVFEQSPVIVVPASQWRHLRQTILADYAFDWGPSSRGAAVVLGYGSLYNHSRTPNARFDYRMAQGIYEFIALRDIARGEEICTNYNGLPEDLRPLWFEPPPASKKPQRKAAKKKGARKR
ncbi:MAG: SET domain-containing protein [Actinomycetota bacterium]